MSKKSKTTISIIVAAIVLFGGAFIYAKMTLPYEITANGETLLLVDNKSTAKSVVREILEDYAPDDSEVVNVALNKELKVGQLSVDNILKKPDTMNKTEAIEYLTTSNDELVNSLELTVVGQVVEEETYTPEPEYHELENALAGSIKVEKEGKDGTRRVTYNITTVNGKQTAKEEVAEEILEEGEKAIIYKGTIGVPEGEDWRTYEGSAVYTSDEDIIARAKAHLGCPYKYGGRSFSKGIDCVWYVVNVYKELGVKVPSRHKDIRKFGKGVSKSNMQPGDIICYGHHVAIYVGNGKMAEATRKYGTRIGKVRGGIITVRRPDRAD